MPLIQRKAKPNDFVVARATLPVKREPSTVMNSALSFTVGTKGTYYSPIRLQTQEPMAYVYHAEKRRPKFKQVKATRRQVRKGDGYSMPALRTIEKGQTLKSERVSQGGWSIRVFAFPLSRIKTIEQHARHFTVVLK